MVKDFYQASVSVGYCRVTNHTKTQGLELSPIYYLYEAWVGWTDLLICSGGTMAHSCICGQLQVGSLALLILAGLSHIFGALAEMTQLC